MQAAPKQWHVCVQVAVMQAQRLSVAFSNLGGILKMQGRLQDAIACYEHVALLQPQVPEVQVCRPSSPTIEHTVNVMLSRPR